MLVRGLKNGKTVRVRSLFYFLGLCGKTTIPYNIAPLNFTVRADGCRVSVLLEAGVVKFKVEAPDGKVRIPEKKWKRLCRRQKMIPVRVTVARKKGDRWGDLATRIVEWAVDPLILIWYIA